MNSVKINCKKILGVVIAALLAATSLFGVLAALPRSAAHADTQNLNNETNASLFLPEKYEEYLKLNTPADAAFSDKYIAIADGNVLYVYDRMEKSYFKTEIPEKERDTITKIGFADNRLFVSTRGAGNHCYEYNFSNKQLNDLSFNCSTFCISGDTLYTATVGGQQTTITSYAISTVNEAHPSSKSLGTLNRNATPSMTLLGGTLYCTIGEHVYYNDLGVNEEFDDVDKFFYLTTNAPDAREVKSTCAHGNAFYYTAASGLYRIELAADGHSSRRAVCVLKAEGLGALTSFDDALYAVKDDAVCRIDFNGEETSLSDYEIAAASASVNRLSNATECVRAGGLIVTADVGNDRISVYDTATGKYQAITCEDIVHVATDGTSIAAATAHDLYVYETSWNSDGIYNEKYPFANVSTYDIAGIVNVHGVYYFATAGYQYGTLSRNGEEWVCSELKVRGQNTTPKAITADLFGDIFVADANGNVYQFSEEDFTTKSDLGNPVANIDSDFASLRAGFDGKLYYLDGDNNLCMHDGTEKQTVATIDGADFVYTETDKKPVSFALGYEDDEVYFCFGDFLVKSDAGALGLATLESVSKAAVDAAAETLSAVKDPRDVLLADFAENAVGVHVDLDAAAGGTDYCLGYARFPEGRRGVLLYTHGAYSLVALYVDHVYSVELFRTADMAGEPFPPEYEDANERPLYLSSACAPYHFPCILGAPARAEVAAPRGTRVTLLAVLRAGGQEAVCGGYDFAYIRYETEARAVAYGYVPYAYLTEVNPLGSDGETFSLGYVKPGVTFTGDDGSQITTTERVSARLYSNGDGTYTAVYTEEGVTYTATVGEKNIEWGESDALRIALIVILSVLAVLIIGGYVYLLPREKKQSKK